ncbi:MULTISPECIES: hypothetical protein [Shewanella]|uniref:hypothetical protein n=1 Tax=Shewanella TaxID=22 RepID=UPI0012FEBBB4|nr:MULTISPECIES: hypothetical protein [Shewanella]MCS6176760.1 hypothetical protein [Shewanella baltica]MCS6211275.1 hypothetical protein [Shewanella baltica]
MSSGALIKADGEIMTMPRTEIQVFCPNYEFKVRHDVLLVKEGVALSMSSFTWSNCYAKTE